MENKSICSFLFEIFHYWATFESYSFFWVDYFADNVVRENLVKTGVSFLSKHEYIYTTRLHGGNFSSIIGKKILFDK